MSVFQIGDKVEALDDVTKGTVTGVSGNEITIETDDGFLLDFQSSELIMILKTEVIKVSYHEVAQIKAEKEASRKRKRASPAGRRPTVRIRERNAPKMEVDLHINQLTNTTRGMSNYEMLNVQLDTAKRQLEFAIKKRIQKVVFIHGVGEGVLKEELYYLFRRYENVKYYDAEYQKYGLGATEVYIFQNP